MYNNKISKNQNVNESSQKQPDLVYKKNRLVDMFFGGLFGAIGGFITVVICLRMLITELSLFEISDNGLGIAIGVAVIGGTFGMGLWYSAWPKYHGYHGCLAFLWTMLLVGIVGYSEDGWPFAATLGLITGLSSGTCGFLGSRISAKIFPHKIEALIEDKIHRRKTDQLFNRYCFMDMLFGGIVGVVGGGIGALSGAVFSDVIGMSSAFDYYGYDVGYAIVFGGLGAVLGMVGLWYRPLNTLTAYNVYAAIIGAALFAGLGGLDSGGGGVTLAVIMSIFAGWGAGTGGSLGVRISMNLFD